jgi:hypothetical protein
MTKKIYFIIFPSVMLSNHTFESTTGVGDNIANLPYGLMSIDTSEYVGSSGLEALFVA